MQPRRFCEMPRYSHDAIALYNGLLLGLGVATVLLAHNCRAGKEYLTSAIRFLFNPYPCSVRSIIPGFVIIIEVFNEGTGSFVQLYIKALSSKIVKNTIKQL